MTKITELLALSIALLVVVSNTVQVSGATAPPNLVETREIPNPKGKNPFTYALSKPLARNKDGKRLAMGEEPRLVVYMHDQGSSIKEPYEQIGGGPPLALSVVLTHHKPMGFASVPSGNAWGDDKDYELISQCIQDALTIVPAKEIVLMGQQMGASMALNYATSAPEVIREKIIGVVCVRGIGDLAKLYEETKVVKLKNQLRLAMRGLPSVQMNRYREKSFNSHIDELGKDVKIAFIQSYEDPVFPTELQEQLAKSLRRKKISVKVIEIGASDFAPPIKWAQGLDFCLFKGLK